MNGTLIILEDKKNLLDSFRPLPPELVTNLSQWFDIELTYTSNALEGNTLTKRETALIVEKGITVGGKSMKEHLEAINFSHAIEFIRSLVHKKRKDITLSDILIIHRIILKGIDDNNAGKLRKIAVQISQSDLQLPSPFQIEPLLDDLVQWVQTTKGHIVTIAMEAHYRLVKIHPFIDGNGRTARLLMNLMLIQEGYPYAIIKKEERLEYLNALSEIDKCNNFNDLYMLIFKAIDRSLDKYLNAILESGLSMKSP